MILQEFSSADGPLVALEPEGLAVLLRAYPGKTARLKHNLSAHPLLGLDALAEASREMNPAHVEVRTAKNSNGEGFPFATHESRDAAQVIRAIEGSGCWVMLRFVEQVPAFAELFARLIEEMAPAIVPATGAPQRLRGFVFISGTGAFTPIHFDPEFNLLMQISGTKRFFTLPLDGPWYTPQVHEACHAGGENLLGWEESYAEASEAYRLAPGEALYVPYKTPHFVEVSEGPSISISLTWASQCSFEQDDAHLCNRWLRRFGFSPAAPAPLPQRNRAKATVYRAVRKLKLG